jgi:hypothetical protein
MKILDIPQSGSVAAVTSSRNRSGQYRRTRALPTQPRTTLQMQARARLSAMSAAWRGLSDNQRASWNGFATTFSVVNSIGTTIQLTGAQCFVKVGCVSLLLGATVLATPPSLPSFGAVSCTGISGAAGTPALALAGTTPSGGITHMIYVSPQMSPGISFCGDWRYLMNLTTYTSGTISILEAYNARWGLLVAKQKIFCKVVQQLAGMQDNGTLFSCIVAV